MATTTGRIWQQCELIAQKLGIDKFRVNRFLYKEIKDRGWLSAILDGEVSAGLLDEIRSLPSWKKMEKQKAEEVEEDQDLIGRAVWFIRQCNDIKQARRVFDAAMSAFEKLKID